MALTKLGIRNFRNLHHVDLEPSEDLNLIIGQNASGKTSLLEAIYFLGRARSFRTHRSDRLVEKGQKSLSVFAQQQLENGKKVPFGVQKDPKMVQIRINEQKINKVADLVKNLPLQLIHPNSHQLLEEGPRYRRQFLDWGVFHVEHRFYPVWHRYQAALKQRNMALRQSSAKELIQVWDKELIESGNLLHQMRTEYVNELQLLLKSYIEPVLGPLDLGIHYQAGWAKELTLEEAIVRSLENDMDRGFTGVGPQRADISIKIDGVLASERISRGQQKILVTCLLLAQAGLFNEKTGRKCVLLIDDVAAELDPDNRNRLLQVLHGMKVQMFLTSIEKKTLLPMRAYSSTSKMFHVEHGKLTDVV